MSSQQIRQKLPGQLKRLNQTSADSRFLYFGYGSNQLTERLQIMNKSAKFVTIGKVLGYELQFGGYFSSRWKGYSATITEKQGAEVWGCVYTLHVEDMSNLDSQEAVNFVYKPVSVEVVTSNHGRLVCRTYQQIHPLKEDQRPSDVYKKVIIKGAMQHSIPDHYVQFLKSIPSNGYDDEVMVDVDVSDIHL